MLFFVTIGINAVPSSYLPSSIFSHSMKDELFCLLVPHGSVHRPYTKPFRVENLFPEEPTSFPFHVIPCPSAFCEVETLQNISDIPNSRE